MLSCLFFRNDVKKLPKANLHRTKNLVLDFALKVSEVYPGISWQLGQGPGIPDILIRQMYLSKCSTVKVLD